ncbi:unnamed protein product [Gordionus sp. m RMFG-2023]
MSNASPTNLHLPTSSNPVTVNSHVILTIQIFLAFKIINIKHIQNNDIDTQTTLNLPINSNKPEDIYTKRIYNKELIYICNNISEETKDALKRAKTTQCKQALINVACKYKSFYPSSIKPTCPLLLTKPKVLGCFIEPPNSPDIRDESVNFVVNSHEKCVSHCFNRQYTYAHLMNGYICHCGFSYNSFGPYVPPTSLPISQNASTISVSKDESLDCEINKCAGDSSQACGSAGSAITIKTGFLDKNALNIQSISRSLKEASKPYDYKNLKPRRRKYLYNRLLGAFTGPNSSHPMPANIRLTAKRFTPIWGGTSLLQVLLYCLELLLKDSYLARNWNWDYYINFSESDFIIRPLDELVNFLTYNNGTNFVKAHQGSSSTRFIQKQGIEHLFHECENHLWRLGKRDLIRGVAYDGASDWLILARSFGRYLIADNQSITSDIDYYNDIFGDREAYDLKEMKDLVNKDFYDAGRLAKREFSEEDMNVLTALKSFFFQALLPGESFFQTLLLNSRFCDRFITNNLHHIKWRRPSGCTCEYKKFVDWCGCSPHNFRTSDLERLIKKKSSDEFMARKFEALIDQNIVKEVERHLHGNEFIDHPNYDSYWFNLYSLAYDDPDNEFFRGSVNSVKRLFFDSFFRETFCSNSLCFGLDDDDTLLDRYYHIMVNKTQLLKVDLYNYQDKFTGILLTYKTLSRQNPDAKLLKRSKKFLPPTTLPQSFTFEILARFEPKEIVERYASRWDLFSRFEVGEKCDFKENFFRNYGFMLSTQSDFRLIVEFTGNASKLFYNNKNSEDSSISILYLWINPLGIIQHSENRTYSTSPDAGQSEKLNDRVDFMRPEKLLSHKEALLPGVWTLAAILSHNLTLLHEKNFVLLPPYFSTKESQKNDVGDPEFYHYFNSHFLDPLSKMHQHKSIEKLSQSNLKELSRILFLPDQFTRDNVFIEKLSLDKNRGKSSTTKPDKNAKYSYENALSRYEHVNNWRDLKYWIDLTVSAVWRLESLGTLKASYSKDQFCLVSNRRIVDSPGSSQRILNRFPEISDFATPINDKNLLNCLLNANYSQNFDQKLYYCDDLYVKGGVQPVFPWSSFSYDPKSDVNWAH